MTKRFFVRSASAKAAEAAAVDAAIVMWVAAGGEIRRVSPLAGKARQEWWEGLRAPSTPIEDHSLDTSFVSEDPEEGPAPWGEIPW